MRKLFLIAALIAAPLHAQSGTQVLPQLSLDKTGSARTVSVRDPVENASRAIGTIDNTGFNSTPQTSKVGARGWLEATISSTESIAQSQSISTRGFIGQLGACRTSDSTATGSQGCQGISGFAINDNTAQLQTGYAGYLEARRYAGAGVTQGLEVNPLNGGSTVDEDPYTLNGAGLTEAYRASAGRSDTTLNNPVSAALTIVPNGAYFRRGVVCAYGSLDPAGSSDCLAMASGYRVSWYASAGVVGAQMYGGIGGAGTTGEFDFSAVNASATAVRCTLMGLANNSFACNGPLDLGLAAYRWNRVYASYVNTNGTPPTTSSSACVAGDQAWDANFEYRCVATNSWRRAALSAF